jgi:hypothetical protein
MKTIELREPSSKHNMTFPAIAQELEMNEKAVFECYRRALLKLQKKLNVSGYKVEDFFGSDYD